MPPKHSSEIETGIYVVWGMGVASVAFGLAIAKTHEDLEKIIPLEYMAWQQIMGLWGAAVLFALLAKYHQTHRYQG